MSSQTEPDTAGRRRPGVAAVLAAVIGVLALLGTAAGRSPSGTTSVP